MKNRKPQKIVMVTNGNGWYHDKVGQKFVVQDDSEDSYELFYNNRLLIRKKDSEFLKFSDEEIDYAKMILEKSGYVIDKITFIGGKDE